MKKQISLLLAFGLLFGCSGVASADVGAKMVPKTDNTYIVNDAPAFAFELNVVDFGSDFLVGAAAVMPYAVFIPERTVTFVKVSKPSYDSPDVDRKWVWWSSVITNS